MIDPAELKTEHIYELYTLIGQYSFHVEGMAGLEIRVKVWLSDVSYGGDRYSYTISHNVHTPTQMGPYYPSAPFATSEKAAVERAIRDTLTFYLGAKKQGHEPSTDWFVPNEDF